MTTLSFFDVNTMLGEARVPTWVSCRTPDDLLEQLDYYRIDEAVAFEYSALSYDANSGNDELTKQTATQPRLHPAWVIPLNPSVRGEEAEGVVARMIDANVRVARIFPPGYLFLAGSRHYAVSECGAEGLFGALESYRCPVLLSGTDLTRYGYGKRDGFSDVDLAHICRTYPSLPIVLLGFSVSTTQVALPLLDEYRNLHVEISYYTAHRGLEFLAHRIGAERILFGTGLPRGNPGPPLLMLRTADIGDEERLLIAGGNLRGLLDGVRP